MSKWNPSSNKPKRKEVVIIALSHDAAVYPKRDAHAPSSLGVAIGWWDGLHWQINLENDVQPVDVELWCALPELP